MFCTNCGAEIPNDSNVCPNCGKAVNNTQTYSQSYSVNDNTHVHQENKSIFKKAGTIFSAIITIIVLIISIRACTMSDEDVNNLVKNFIPTYATAIQNDKPAGYNTSLTYGQAFNRYFKNCKWSEETRNSEPIVRFTGIFDNGNDTYSKAEVIFTITDMGDEFYYNIDTVIVDGLDLGLVGIYGLMEDVFSNSTSY